MVLVHEKWHDGTWTHLIAWGAMLPLDDNGMMCLKTMMDPFVLWLCSWIPWVCEKYHWWLVCNWTLISWRNASEGLSLDPTHMVDATLVHVILKVCLMKSLLWMMTYSCGWPEKTVIALQEALDDDMFIVVHFLKKTIHLKIHVRLSRKELFVHIYQLTW